MAILQSIVLTPSYQSARDFRGMVEPTLRRISVADSEVSNCLTAISEVLVNLVEHGNPKASQIGVTVTINGGYWSLSVSDDGGAFHDLTETIASKSSEHPDMLRESGMGLMILNQYFPEWSYEVASETGGQNVLRIGGAISDAPSSLPLVLLVEDEEIQIEIISSYLESEFVVAAASTVADALRLVSKRTPDLILSDIRLPDGDGLTFRQQIRHDRALASIPFVFLTGVQNESTATEADTLGVDDYLTKPVEKSRLLSVLRRVMTRTRQLREIYGDKIDQKLSRALVSKPPKQFSGWNCAARSESASAGGGDLLYHRALPDGDLIVLADLMGHGETAKFHATITGGFLTGLLSGMTSILAPSTILSALSKAFFNEPTLSETIATAMAVVVRKDGTVSIASAGHPSPMLISNGALSSITVSGALLGLDATSEYETYEGTFDDRDQLVFLTDGALELGPHTQHERALNMLKARLVETASQEPQSVADAIFDLVFELSPDGLKDDATAFVMKRGGQDA